MLGTLSLLPLICDQFKNSGTAPTLISSNIFSGWLSVQSFAILPGPSRCSANVLPCSPSRWIRVWILYTLGYVTSCFPSPCLEVKEDQAAMLFPLPHWYLLCPSQAAGQTLTSPTRSGAPCYIHFPGTLAEMALALPAQVKCPHVYTSSGVCF